MQGSQRDPDTAFAHFKDAADLDNVTGKVRGKK